MKSYKSWSTTKPTEWDATSSANYVYHNTNIVEKTVEEEGSEMVVYEYDVDEYTNKEYMTVMTEDISEAANTADMAYVDGELALALLEMMEE